MNTINMCSMAQTVPGQGVFSAYQEQVRLVQEKLSDQFSVSVNRPLICDITHYHTINLRYFLTLPLVKMYGKTVGYVHFLPETLEDSLRLPGWFRPVFYRYIIRFYKSMDSLVTVNPAFIDRLAAYGIDRSKITYIPNFVDERTFSPLTPAQRRQARRIFGLDADRFTVVCAGQLQTRKGVLDFAELARRMPQVQFVWAGGFSFGRITEGFDEIRKLRKAPPENLYFPGILPREEMCAFYGMADVMLLPSYAELFPMTVLEAMSCGTPVVLRDLDIYPGILFDFYRKADSVDGFELLILRMMSNPQEMALAREDARRGSAFYSRERIAKMWRQYYQCVLCGEKGTAVPVPAKGLIRL